MRLAKAHATRVDSSDVHKGNNRWKRAEFARRAPGLDWERYFTAAGLGQAGRLHRLAAVGGDRPRRRGARGAARHLEGLPRPCAPSRAPPRSCPGRSSTRASRSTAPCSPAPRSCASAGSAPSTPPARRWARRSAGCFVERYFPASEKARAEEMVKNELAAFGRRIDALAVDVARPPSRRPRPSSPRSRSASATPIAGTTHAGLEIVPGDAYGNQARAELFRLPAGSSPSSARPSTAASGPWTPHLVNAVNRRR